MEIFFFVTLARQYKKCCVCGDAKKKLIFREEQNKYIAKLTGDFEGHAILNTFTATIIE